jgi:hypothetical protein
MIDARVVKRLLLALVLLASIVVLGVDGSLSAATTTATQIASGDGAGSASAAFSTPVVAGSAVIVVLTNYSDSPGDLEGDVGPDDEGDTFTKVAQYGNRDGAGNAVSIWVNYDVHGGTTTIGATATANGDGTDGLTITAYDVVGVTGLDATADAAGTGRAISTGTVTTHSSNEFSVAGVSSPVLFTTTVGSGWGDFESHGDDIVGSAEDQEVTSAGSMTGTMALSGARPWSAAIATFTTSTSSTTCPVPSESFAIGICGNTFVNQAGTRVILRGVNVTGTQYDCARATMGFYDDPTIRPASAGFPSTPGNWSTEISAMENWGINVVRINLNEQCWLGTLNPGGAPSGLPASTTEDAIGGTFFPVPPGDSDQAAHTINAYEYEMGQYVAALNAAGIYAEIDLHLNAPGDEVIANAMPGDDFQNPLPDANSDDFWRSVAAYFHNDPAVIFGVFNEPFTPDAVRSGDTSEGWSDDEGGATVPDCTAVGTDDCATVANGGTASSTYAGEGMVAMIHDIRDEDGTAPLVVGGPDFAGDMDDWLNTFDPGGVSVDTAHQMAASVHIYWDDSGSDSPCSSSSVVNTACPGSVGDTGGAALTDTAADFPVLIDEIGNTTCTHTAPVFSFLQSVDAWNTAHSTDIGYLGWAWTTASGCDPTMLASGGFTSGKPAVGGEAQFCEMLNLGIAPPTNTSFSTTSGTGHVCTGTIPSTTPS